MNLGLKNILNRVKTDIQTNQTIIVMMVLMAGVYIFGLNMDVYKLLITFGTTTLLDLFIVRYETGEWRYPFSGTNAGFGISFFLRSESYFVYFFAAVLAIVGKHIFRINGRHFMNPSNMAVFLTLVLIPQLSWTNPLQWGKIYERGDFAYLLALVLIFLFGLLIIWRLSRIKKVQQFDLPLVFIASHLLLFGYFVGWNTHLMVLFFTPSFLVYTFFMITDPKTSPETPATRILFATAIALMFYVLWYFMNENYSLLGALFLLSLTLPLIWKLKENVSIFGFVVAKNSLLLIVINVMLLVSLTLLVYINGKPDLIFDNRCNQLVCRIS